MGSLIRFLLNDREVSLAAPSDTPLLTALRDEFLLMGTKPGCREGDCGACTVLIGEVTVAGLRYRNVVACLMPVGQAHGRHVVTIEGLNQDQLSPVQKAMVDHGGQQCGFCTPGFVVSLSQLALDATVPTQTRARAVMDGNICRCTGYGGILRAADEVVQGIRAHHEVTDRIAWAVQHGYVPPYFTRVASQLSAMDQRLPVLSPDHPAVPAGVTTRVASSTQTAAAPSLAGGTDLMVKRQWSKDPSSQLFQADMPGHRIHEVDGVVVIQAGATGTDLGDAECLIRMFPRLPQFLKLVASTQIRNMGTVAGNLVNASPIGDYTIMLLALGARLSLKTSKGKQRTLPLDALYRGYKALNKADDELLVDIRVDVPSANSRFNFEKVSKRTHLDIASVNTAIQLEVQDGAIVGARLSAGGVGPTPMVLARTSAWLNGKPFSLATFEAAGQQAQQEISPISDVRGTARYKRLLLDRLIVAHFHEINAELEGEAA